jgi:HEAT repeat protein
VQWLIAAWLVGVVVLGMRFLAGIATTRRLRSQAGNTDDRLHAALGRASARAGIGVVPQLVVSDRVGMPCAFGWFRPAVVLPAGARDWSTDRLDMVLLHEATHIRRGDYVTHLVAEIAKIVHWYNPLVWLAARSLRAEAERATDDRVIGAGTTASEYAGHLLDIVRSAGARRIPAPMLPLAARSEFEGRVIAILENAGSSQLRVRTAVTVLAIGIGLSGAIASIGAAEPPVRPVSSVILAADSADRSSVPDVDDEERPATNSRRQDAQSVPDATVAALMGALDDSVASVRLAVVNALSSARDTTVIRALMRVLREDESAEVRRAAAHSLGEIGDALAVPALVTALESDENLEVRIHAAEALGAIEVPAAADALARGLSRASDASLKIAVIESLDNHEEHRATSALTAALRDEHPGVRVAAAEALGGVEDRNVIPALLAAARDDDVMVRRAVIDALSDFDDPRLTDVFASALSDRDAEIRRAAASGLGNIDGLRTAPRQLIAALDDADPEVRQEAAHALGHMEDPASLSALIARVTDPVADVRLAVVEALSEFADASVTAALQRALRDSNADVREAAASALGERRRK